MFLFFPSQGLVEHILVDISWIMVGNYVKRKKKWCLMKRWVKLPKVKEKKYKKRRKRIEKNRKEKCSFVFLRFYVDGVWNQMKLSIGA